MYVDVHCIDYAEAIPHLPFLVASLVHGVPPGERACQESWKGRGGSGGGAKRDKNTDGSLE